MKKILKSFTITEWLIYFLSVVSIIVSFFVFHNDQYHYLIGSLIGVTALIFVSKGNPIGEFLTIVFAIFYGIISYSFAYYGEMITYLAMTAPISIAALVMWLKNPSKGNAHEVKVNHIGLKEWILLLFGGTLITVAFYFILLALNTANLIVSTISVLTSFIACYLTFRRSRFYALAYALNDIVLVILWSIASASSLTYIPMIICFVAFLANDIYGFINWTKMRASQKSQENSTDLELQ